MPGSAPRAGRLAQLAPRGAGSTAARRSRPQRTEARLHGAILTTSAAGRDGDREGTAASSGVGSSAGIRAGASLGSPRGAGSVPGSAPRQAAARRRPSLPARGTDAKQRFGRFVLFFFSL